MPNAISARLSSFTREETGLSSKKVLSANTLLAEDLGLTGDEASDFMIKFFKNFQVDGGDFDFHRYFLMEGEGLLYALIRSIATRKRHKLARRPITLAMLDQAIAERTWITERLEALNSNAA
jgi:hypothetical protein